MGGWHYCPEPDHVGSVEPGAGNAIFDLEGLGESSSSQESPQERRKGSGGQPGRAPVHFLKEFADLSQGWVAGVSRDGALRPKKGSNCRRGQAFLDSLEQQQQPGKQRVSTPRTQPRASRLRRIQPNISGGDGSNEVAASAEKSRHQPSSSSSSAASSSSSSAAAASAAAAAFLTSTAAGSPRGGASNGSQQAASNRGSGNRAELGQHGRHGAGDTAGGVHKGKIDGDNNEARVVGKKTIGVGGRGGCVDEEQQQSKARRFGNEIGNSADAAPDSSQCSSSCMIVEEEAPPPPGSPDSSVVVVDSGGPISPKRRKADRGEDVAFATVLREVGSNRSPSKLDMRRYTGGYLNVERMGMLCSALCSNTSSTRLDLQGCMIGDAGVLVLVEHLLLSGSSSLVWLDLALNDVNDGGARALLRVIEDDSSPLEYLDLKDNMISDEMGREMTSARRRATTLETLDLARNAAPRRRGGGGGRTKLSEHVEKADRGVERGQGVGGNAIGGGKKRARRALSTSSEGEEIDEGRSGGATVQTTHLWSEDESVHSREGSPSDGGFRAVSPSRKWGQGDDILGFISDDGGSDVALSRWKGGGGFPAGRKARSGGNKRRRRGIGGETSGGESSDDFVEKDVSDVRQKVGKEVGGRYEGGGGGQGCMEKVHIVRKESSRGGGWGAVREGGMSQGVGAGGRGGAGRAGASQTSESSLRSSAGGACGGGRTAGWSNEMHFADAADALSDFGGGRSGGGREGAGSLRMNKSWSSSSSRQGKAGADGGAGRGDEAGRRMQQQQHHQQRQQQQHQQPIYAYFAPRGTGENPQPNQVPDDEGAQVHIGLASAEEDAMVGGTIPRFLPVSDLSAGLPLPRWELPNACRCVSESECPILQRRPSPGEEAMWYEGCFARCTEHLSMLRGQGGVESESPIDSCVLAFFSHVKGAVQAQGCSRGACVAVLRGLRGMLLDNGYIGQLLVERRRWAMLYGHLLAASVHWVFYIGKRIAACPSEGSGSGRDDAGLLHEYSIEGYFKRIMRVLLYLLDKGCDGAGMGCAPRNVLVAAAAARSRGGAGYEPEKNGAGLQVEMLLQVWAELAKVGSMEMPSGQEKGRYWDVLEAALNASTKQFSLVTGTNAFTLPSLSSAPAVAARSGGWGGGGGGGTATCTAEQAKELQWVVVCMSVLVHRARGTPIPSSAAKLVESPWKAVDRCVRESPLCSAPTAAYSEGTVFAVGGGGARAYELGLVERVRWLVVGLNSLPAEGGGRAGCGWAGLVPVLSKWAMLGQKRGAKLCCAADVARLGAGGGSFDFSADRRRGVAAGGGYKVFEAVMDTFGGFVESAGGGGADARIQAVKKVMSSCLNDFPADPLVAFSGLASQRGLVQGLAAGGGAERGEPGAGLATWCSMLAFLVSLSKGRDGGGEGEYKEGWMNAWMKLSKLAIIDKEGAFKGGMLQPGVGESTVLKELEGRESFVECAIVFFKAAASSKDVDRAHKAADILLLVLASLCDELSHMITATAADASIGFVGQQCELFLAGYLDRIGELARGWGGAYFVGAEVRKCLSAFSGRPAGKRVESKALGVVTAACQGTAKEAGAAAESAADAAGVAAVPLIGNKPGVSAPEKLAKSAWPILREYMSERLRGESPSSEAVGLASAAVPACALLTRLLSAQNPASQSLANIRAFFDASKSDLARKASHEARALPVLFLSEGMATSLPLSPDEERQALNAWLLSVLEITVHRPKDKGESVQLALARRLASTRTGSLAHNLMQGVFAAYHGAGGGDHAHEYDGRRRALVQFSGNAGLGEASKPPPAVFDQLCRFVSQRIEDGGRKGCGESYLSFLYQAMSALVPACAASMQACMQGARGTVLHDLAKLLIRRPPPLALENASVSLARHKFVRAMLSTVSTLNYTDGPGHAKIAKIAKACIRVRLDHDCTKDSADGKVMCSALSLRTLLSLGGGDHAEMRPLVRLIIRYIARDMGDPAVLRAMRASSLLAEVARDVYMAVCPRSLLVQRAEELLTDAAEAFAPCANLSRKKEVASAHYRALTALLLCARDAGVRYNAVLEKGGRPRQGFFRFAAIEALFRAVETMFLLGPKKPTGETPKWSDEAGEVLETHQIMRRNAQKLLEAYKGFERESRGAGKGDASSSGKIRGSMTPDSEWYEVVDRSVRLRKKPPGIEGAEQLVKDALEFVSVCFHAGDAARQAILMVIPRVNKSAMTAMTRMQGEASSRAMQRYWTEFLQSLGPPGAVYLANMSPGLEVVAQAQSRLQDSVFWIDRGGLPPGTHPAAWASPRRGLLPP